MVGYLVRSFHNLVSCGEDFGLKGLVGLKEPLDLRQYGLDTKDWVGAVPA